MHFSVDASYVVNAFPQTSSSTSPATVSPNLLIGQNGDVWERLQQRASAAASASITKVPSHVGATAVRAGLLTIDQLVGNTLADLAAGLAVERSLPPGALVENVERLTRTAWAVLRRAAYIETQGWTTRWQKVPRPPEQPTPTQITIQEARQTRATHQRTAGHRLRQVNRHRWQCTRCLATTTKARAQKFMDQTCPGTHIILRAKGRETDSAHADPSGASPGFGQPQMDATGVSPDFGQPQIDHTGASPGFGLPPISQPNRAQSPPMLAGSVQRTQANTLVDACVRQGR